LIFSNDAALFGGFFYSISQYGIAYKQRQQAQSIRESV